MWCDMCEKEVKDKVHKLGSDENTIYLCDKDWKNYIKACNEVD